MAHRIVNLKASGSFKHTNSFFSRVLNRSFYRGLERYGQLGVDALKSATPVDTGKTAESWRYSIFYDKNTISIKWYNDNQADWVPIVILLQYGHATKDGRFIRGLDFINPAIRPIFEEISESIWKEVTEE